MTMINSRAFTATHPSGIMGVLTSGLSNVLTEVLARLNDGRPPNAPSNILKKSGLTPTGFGGLDHAVELVLSPARLVAGGAFDGIDHIVDPRDKARFHSEAARYYYDGLGEALARWHRSCDEFDGDVQIVMEAIIDALFHALLRQAPENAHVIEWKARIEARAPDPEAYLRKIVSQNTISVGGVPVEISVDVLKMLANVAGPEALRDLAKAPKAHIAIPPGASETVGGELPLGLVAVGQAGVHPDQTETMAPLLARKDTTKIVAEQAKKATLVWFGCPSAPAEARSREIMRAVLRDIGWHQDYAPTPVPDAMLDALMADRLAFPKGIAAGQPAPNSDRLVKSLVAPKLGHVSDESGAMSAAKSDAAAGNGKLDATEPTMGVLLRETEKFDLATIDIAQIGLSRSGKTSVVLAWIDRLSNRSTPLFAGAGDAVPGDRVTRTKRDALPSWRKGEPVPGTGEVSQCFSWKFGETFEVRVHDYDGRMLAYEGEGSEIVDALDPALRAEFGRASGFVVPIADARLLAAARGEAADQDGLTACMEQLGERVRTAFSLQRGRDHMPIVILVAGIDQVLPAEDFARVYGNGRLIGDAGGAVLSGLRTEVLREHALRSAVGTVSRAGQQAVDVVMTQLAPLFAALRPFTRQVEVVLTSALAADVDGRGPSDGPAEALRQLMVTLLPAFVAQTEDLLKAQRAGFRDIERMAKAVESDCRTLIVDPRFDALRAWVPGQRTLAKKFKRSRLMGLTPRLKAMGLDAQVTPETTNGGFKALLDESRARVAHTRAEYDLIERRILALKEELALTGGNTNA